MAWIESTGPVTTLNDFIADAGLNTAALHTTAWHRRVYNRLTVQASLPAVHPHARCRSAHNAYFTELESEDQVYTTLTESTIANWYDVHRYGNWQCLPASAIHLT